MTITQRGRKEADPEREMQRRGRKGGQLVLTFGAAIVCNSASTQNRSTAYGNSIVLLSLLY